MYKLTPYTIYVVKKGKHKIFNTSLKPCISNMQYNLHFIVGKSILGKR